MRIVDIRKLDAELRALVAGERRKLVEFLRRLDVLDRERAYCEFNCGSTWEYLTRELHLCEGTAAGRVTSMRLIRRFPRLEAELESGRLNPSQLLVLAPALTEANFEGLVREAAGLTKEKTKELVVAVRPRAVPADGIRKLPRPAAAATASAVPVQVNSLCPDIVGEALVLTAPAAASVAQSRPPDRGAIEPTAKDDFQFRAHMDTATKHLFDQLAEVVSHAIPDRAPARLLAMMVRDSLEVQKRKRGLLQPTRARRPAPAKEPTPGIRQPVSAEVRRQVLERDGNRCTHVSHDGERCPVTEGLEMDHIEGALVTGSSTADELRVRCKPHNHYLAMLKLGRRFMERKIAQAREARKAKGGKPPRDPTAGEEVAQYAASGCPPAPHAAAA